MSEKPREFPHIYWPEQGNSESYTRPSQGGGSTSPPERDRAAKEKYRSPQSRGSTSPPERDRAAHAKILLQAMAKAMNAASQQLNSREPEIATGVPGFYLEFKLKATEKIALKSLENFKKKIELVAVNKIPSEGNKIPIIRLLLREINSMAGILFLHNGMIKATVFVPQSAADYFEKKIEQYRDKAKNEALVSRLETVEIGTVKSLFTDKDPSLFPEDDREVWWEVWLRKTLQKDIREEFNQVARKLEIPVRPRVLSFPEREIVLVMSDVKTMARLIKNSDAVAELRIAKDTPSIFLKMGALEQAQWAKDLAGRLVEPEEDAVSICLLDSGATRINPLLSLALGKNDLHAVEPSWGVNDNPNWRGHGTAMAGLCLYSDSLIDKLATPEKVKLLHRLESVKILPPSGQNDPELFGVITEEGVSLPEIEVPHRSRVFCMAVTSSSTNGTPSSWSAAVDRICFNDGKFRRLMIISAGNIRQDIFLDDYLNINDLEAIENPGQAWNALIVGAYTEKINIIAPNDRHLQPLAPGGDLSPRSRTSVTWEPQWPVRPDVVFEGGNMVYDPINPSNKAVLIDDFCLLTTYYRPKRRIFNDMSDTSCATALASYMAARIMSERPNYRPETVRALIVHSAEWTPAMQRHFESAPNKTAKCAFLRRYGYGVPDLKRALQGASNNLTLIIEDELQPFLLEKTNVTMKARKLHKLPLPREKLEELGEVNVELKVTLSYFIEPNPGERGYAYRHRYASHGLRFKVKGSFRISRDTDDNKWFLGPTARDGGSIHSDIWYGTAVELAEKDAIAIYPVGGWWKEKKYLERYNSLAYYSLIVSIRVPEVGVDIYTPVSNLVGTLVPIET